jgi:hypothetical protein
MKRFVKDIVLFGLLCSMALGLWIYFNYLPRNVFLSQNRPKHLRLKTMARPRVILVGGSNLLMGMESEELEKELSPYHAVNMSLTVSMGAELQIHDIEREIESGDVIVVSLEYENVAGPSFDQVTGVYALESIEHHPGSIAALTGSQLRTLVSGSLLEYSGIVLRQSRFHLKNLWNPVRKLAFAEEQVRFNNYGDAVFQRNENPKFNRRFVGLPEQLNAVNLSRTVELLNGLADRCKSRGASCYFSYPPYPESTFKKNSGYLKQLETALKAGIKMPILGTPGEMVMPDAFFWDTQYHLLKDGPRIRTQRLINQLKPFLKTNSTVQKQ